MISTIHAYVSSRALSHRSRRVLTVFVHIDGVGPGSLGFLVDVNFTRLQTSNIVGSRSALATFGSG
jgi:hypothetical protein